MADPVRATPSAEHLAAADRILEQTAKAADRAIVSRAEAVRLRAMMRRADDDLTRRLARVVRLTGGPEATFDQARGVAHRAQIRAATTLVEHRVSRIAGGSSAQAVKRSMRDAGLVMRTMERLHTGSVVNLALERAQVLDSLSARRTGSLLSQIQASVDRYGTHVIRAAEKELQRALLVGESQGEMVARLVGLRGGPGLYEGSSYWAERIVRTECLAGDTVVSAAVVVAATRRWHEGSVFEIRTSGGRKFTTTANHPMLTRRGWVVSGELRQGDDLICHARKQDSRASGDQDVAAGKTTIAELFDSLHAVGIAERRGTAKPDFHGDGADGYVDIARPCGRLEVGRFAPLYKPVVENIFAPSDLAAAGFCGHCKRLLSLQRQDCGCQVADGDAGFSKSPDDGAVIDLEICRDRNRGFARLVPGDDGVSGEGQVARVASSVLESDRQRSGDAGIFDSSANEHGAQPRGFVNALDAEAGEIEFDRVVSVALRSFSGHVYNLSTPYGYFGIDGAYTGNCAYAYNVIQLDLVEEGRKEFPDMAKKIIATFDQKIAPDSVYVHGQIRKLGEYFTDGAGRQYEFPPARPNDREIIIPWRAVWPETPFTRQRPLEEVAAAKVACTPGLKTKAEKRRVAKRAKEVVKADREKAKRWRRHARDVYGPAAPASSSKRVVARAAR